MKTVPLVDVYHRVADPDRADPLDPSFAAAGAGQRWNPPGLLCLYLNRDEATARANVTRLYAGLPCGTEDLDPATAPLLIDVSLPGGAADALTDDGLLELGLDAVLRHAVGVKARRRSVFERFHVLAPWAPSMVFFSRRSWRERGSEAFDVLTDLESNRAWFIWAMASVLGIPAGLVGLAFESGDSVRIGGLVLLIVCLLIFWGGLKALDRRINDRLAEDLASARKGQQS
jgi:hypothetical protein